MKNSPVIAALADVHGNYLALKACLDYAKRRGATHYLFLGDYVTSSSMRWSAAAAAGLFGETGRTTW